MKQQEEDKGRFMKKAFTISEIVVVLVITAVIMMVTIYSFGNMQPEKNKIMFKKAYNVVERVSQELANDESIYPYDPENIGFKNTERACVPGNIEECYQGNLKFEQFFARRLDVVGNAGLDLCRRFTFETSDGIAWYILDSSNSSSGCLNGPIVSPSQPTPVNPGTPTVTLPVNPGTPTITLPVKPGAPTITLPVQPTPPPSLYSIPATPSAAAFSLDIPSVVIMVDVNGSAAPNSPDNNRVLQIHRSNNPDQAIRALPKDTNRDRYFIIVDFDGRARVASGSLEAEYLRSQEVRKKD